jgi:hypothetical protein
MLSIALEVGFGFVLGLNLINQNITHEGRWITFLKQHDGRISVTGLETVSRDLPTI